MPNWKKCNVHNKNYDADKYPDGCFLCTHPNAQAKLNEERADHENGIPHPTTKELPTEVKFTFALTAVQQAVKIMEIHKGEVIDFERTADSVYKVLEKLAK